VAHAPESEPRRLAAPLLLPFVLLLLLVPGCGGGGGDSGSGGGAATEQADTGAGTEAGGPGTVMAAGQNVFEQVLGGPGALEGVRDMEVVGTSVAVEEIVNERGFWIGTSEADRIFLELEGTGAPAVKAGEKVSFTGVMEQNLGAETYGISEDGGAQQFRDQGLHVQVQAGDLEKG
jgi:hypothetical protein